MKKNLCILTLFFPLLAHADDNIKLILTKYSNTKECKNFRKFKAEDNRNSFKQFSIPDEDYLTVSLFSKNNKKCYSLKYYPDFSPVLHFVFSNKQIKIEEIPSIATANRFYKLYQMDIAHQKFVYKDTVQLN